MPTPNSSRGNDYAELFIPKPIRENNAHKAVYDALVSAGVDQTTLSSCLYFLGTLARSSGTDVGHKRNPWPGIAMTQRQLRGFPQRIITMAREIERLNAASLFDPARWVPTSTSPDNEAFLKFLAEMHSRLPGFLDTYAAYLHRRFAELGQFGKTKFSVSKGIRMKLSETVHRATGNYHDEKLADLIAAVTGEVLTGDDLKRLRKRNPKFRKNP
jgi:hypothetical protein